MPALPGRFAGVDGARGGAANVGTGDGRAAAAGGRAACEPKVDSASPIHRGVFVGRPPAVVAGAAAAAGADSASRSGPPWERGRLSGACAFALRLQGRHPL